MQRVYVDASIYADFLSRTVDATRRLKVGSKMDPDTDIGPLIDESAARRVEDWVDSAAADGAVIQTGGTRTGAFYEPTILTDVAEGAQILTDEVFGPVVTIIPFDDLADAVSAANSGEYALQAGRVHRSPSRPHSRSRRS